MTKKTADNVIFQNKETVKKIIELLHGETLEDAKNILDAVAVYLKVAILVDSDCVKDVIDDIVSDNE